MEIFYLLHQALLGDVVIQEEFGTVAVQKVRGAASQRGSGNQTRAGMVSTAVMAHCPAKTLQSSDTLHTEV